MNLTGNPSSPGLDARYLGFFDCFNRGHYFEAHEVLEELWLQDRKAPDALFYKGLIQLAGAFVHLQKNRPGPAASLLKLAQTNLQLYPEIHHSLDIGDVLRLIQSWLDGLTRNLGADGYLTGKAAPKVKLLAPGGVSGAES